MGHRDRMSRMTTVRELRGCRLERAPKTAGAAGELRHGLEGREELGPRSLHRQHLGLKPGPELGIRALEIGRDEIVLRWEVAVQRYLRNARGSDDRVDPDRLVAVTVEEFACSVEDAVASGVCAAPLRFRHHGL